MKFKKTDKISLVLENHPHAEEIFLGFGMHCLHCMMANDENIEEACNVHGIDAEEVVNMLNFEIEKEEDKSETK